MFFAGMYIVFCRGRCPHRPVAGGTGVSVFSDRSVNVPHGAMRASHPTLKTHVFCRRRCPYRPMAGGTGVSVFSDRSVNVPHGAMRASPPTLKTHVFCRGRCPHRPESRRFRIGKTKCSSLLLYGLKTSFGCIQSKRTIAELFQPAMVLFIRFQKIRTRTSSRCNPSAH